MTMAAPLINELVQEAATTRRVLERVPEDKLSWRPHERSMSLGQLALHIAQTPGGVAAILEQTSFSPNFQDRAQPASRAEILGALDAAIEQAKTRLQSWSDADLMTNWSLLVGGKTVMTVPRAGVVRTIMLNHWYHHRGQLTVYLRLLGVPLPSVYGPTADENPFE